MLSSNAPFDEKGFSHVIRDIERHELLLSGSRQGDMGTSTGTNLGPLSVNQETDNDGIGGSPLATLADLEALAATIPDASPITAIPVTIAQGGTGATSLGGAQANLGIPALPVSYANGGTAATTQTQAALNLGSLRLSLGYSSSVAGSGTYVVPAGVYKIRIILIGAGGGYGASTTPGTVFGYVAGSSGGSPTTAITLTALNGGSGGSGSVLMADLPVTPGASYSYAIGAAGTSGASPTNGGGSTFSDGSFVLLTALGGAKGSAASSSQPGGGGSGGVAFNSTIIDVGGIAIPGQAGAPGTINYTIGSAMPTIGQNRGGPGWDIAGNSIGTGGTIGAGGNSNGGGNNATDGAIAIFY